MTIHFSRNRLLVGMRRKNWSRVWYQPIFGSEDENAVPDIGLYPTSNEKTNLVNDIMLGEVAWEHLFEPKHFESSVAKERALMQRQVLYEAWQYLRAKDPAEVDYRRKQLEGGDPRRRALARESSKVRKLRSRVQKSRRKEVAESGGTAKSIESDSDSESGYESGDGGGLMPPPPRPPPRSLHPSGEPREMIDILDDGPREDIDLLMSGTRGSSTGSRRDAGDDGVEGEDTGGRDSASVASSQRATTGARGTKRKQPSDAGSQQNSGQRIYQEEGGVFLTQSPDDTQQRQANEQDETALDQIEVDSRNGGMNEHEAMAAAIRNSEVRELGYNGGLDDDEAARAALRESRDPDEARNEAACASGRKSMVPGESGNEAARASARESMVPDETPDEEVANDSMIGAEPRWGLDAED